VLAGQGRHHVALGILAQADAARIGLLDCAILITTATTTTAAAATTQKTGRH
jgi:hypothetical protein